MTEDKEMTEEEAKDMLRQMGESKQTLHSFFSKVIKSSSTTRVGNLDVEELGKPKLPVRTHLELETFCKEIAGDDSFGNYFKKIAEVHSSSSLSKDGFLMKLAVTMKKELADVSPVKRKNSGWFKKKGGGVPSQDV